MAKPSFYLWSDTEVASKLGWKCSGNEKLYAKSVVHNAPETFVNTQEVVCLRKIRLT